MTISRAVLTVKLLEKMRDACGDGWTSKLLWILRRVLFLLRSWFFDEAYAPFTEDEIVRYARIWKRNVLPRLSYKYEVFDCDDYAMYFATWLKKYSGKNGAGIAVGCIRKEDEPSVHGCHAWNVVLVRNEVWFFEPQTGELIKNNRSSDGWIYELKGVII